MSVKIERINWSNSSRRSSAYTGHLKDYYSESTGCRCRKCFRSFSFTPEEQKIAYEVDKKIIHYVPSLYHDCRKNYEKLASQVKNFQTAWNINRECLKSDMNFILGWLQAIREKNSYGKRVNEGRERMLLKLLQKLPY